MAPPSTLNNGQQCMQELDQFSHCMGWTFKNLGNREDSDLHTSHDDPDLHQTAFADVINIPSDFVAPTSTSSSRATRQKCTSNPSRLYRKRATRPTASSSAKTHPGDSRSSMQATPDPHRSTSSTKSPLQHKKRGHKSSNKAPKAKAEPMDFVYDIDVRRRLREQIDADRRRVLQEAKAREAQLRADNKWVFDKRDQKSPPRRKQAWQTDASPQKTNSSTSDSKRCRSETASVGSSARSSASCRSYPPSVTYLRPNKGREDTAEAVEGAIHEFERRLQAQWSLHTDSN